MLRIILDIANDAAATNQGPRKGHSPHALRMSWLAIDHGAGTLAENTFNVNPTNWKVSKQAASATGLTHGTLKSTGKSLKEILGYLATDMAAATHLICYDIIPTISALLSEAREVGLHEKFMKLKTIKRYSLKKEALPHRGNIAAIHAAVFGHEYRNKYSGFANMYALARLYYRLTEQEMPYKDIPHRPIPPPKLTLTESQNYIVKLSMISNVMGDARAGSGKTRTISGIAKAAIKSKILVLTYSKQLQKDSAKRFAAMGLNNADICTIHAALGRIYGGVIYTEDHVKTLINSDRPPRHALRYSIVVIDEAQDLTPLLFRAVVKLLKDHATTPYCTILGDRYQNIYSCMGSDSRFLTHASDLLETEHKWEHAELRETFRLTPPVSDFVNAFLGYNCITSRKVAPGAPRPLYIIANPWKDSAKVFKLIQKRLTEHTDATGPIESHDIFIIGKTARFHKRRLGIHMLVDQFSNNTPYTIYVQDTGRVDPDVYRDKLIASSIHQTKGCGRKVIILFDFHMPKGVDDPKEIENYINLMYVACTRSEYHLIIVHDSGRPYLPNVELSLPKVADVVELRKKATISAPTRRRAKVLGLDSLIIGIPSIKEKKIKSLIGLTSEEHKGCEMGIPLSAPQTYDNGMSGVENVAKINTWAAIVAHQYKTCGHSDAIAILMDSIKSSKRKRETAPLIERLSTIVGGPKWSAPKILEISTLLESFVGTSLGHIRRQVTNFNWLTNESLAGLTTRMDALGISATAKYAQRSAEMFGDFRIDSVTGIIDKDNKSCYYIACESGAPSFRTIVLAAMRAFIAEHRRRRHGAIKDEPMWSHRIFNIYDGSTHTITGEFGQLQEIFNELVHKSPRSQVVTEEFIKKYKYVQTPAAPPMATNEEPMYEMDGQDPSLYM